jgi:uncharacterized membrane protein YfcA
MGNTIEVLIYVAIGLTVGSVSGLMGIGGGVLLVPALMWLCHFKPSEAAGTSLAILIPPIGLPAALRAYQQGLVDVPAALWIAGSFMVGAYLSRDLVHYIADEWFRLIFGLLMIFIAVRFVIHADSEATSAAAGLTAAFLAWLAFLGLKAVGRRYLPRPDLGELIQAQHQRRPEDRDYQI